MDREVFLNLHLLSKYLGSLKNEDMLAFYCKYECLISGNDVKFLQREPCMMCSCISLVIENYFVSVTNLAFFQIFSDITWKWTSWLPYKRVTIVKVCFKKPRIITLVLQMMIQIWSGCTKRKFIIENSAEIIVFKV